MAAKHGVNLTLTARGCGFARVAMVNNARDAFLPPHQRRLCPPPSYQVLWPTLSEKAKNFNAADVL